MKMRIIGYWITTTLVVLSLVSGGLTELAHQRDTVAGMVHLGYPVYFVTILGFWKVLGAIALLVPRFPRLKEWAYAGAFFDFTGAAASHVASGDPAWHVAVTLSITALAIASWALRPQSRVLGVLFAAKQSA